VRALLQNPDQLRLLRDAPGLIASATEEILRWVTPTVQFVRTAVEDYVLRGQLIRKGESCALLFGSGNRDEEVFGDADVFRITRHPNPHLAFGSGPHSCLGSQLARIELRCFLTVLLERFAHMELCGPTPCIAANLVTRIEKMPMRYRFH
jgi:cytochrome P450